MFDIEFCTLKCQYPSLDFQSSYNLYSNYDMGERRRGRTCKFGRPSLSLLAAENFERGGNESKMNWEKNGEELQNRTLPSCHKRQAVYFQSN